MNTQLELIFRLYLDLAVDVEKAGIVNEDVLTCVSRLDDCIKNLMTTEIGLAPTPEERVEFINDAKRCLAGIVGVEINPELRDAINNIS